MRPFPTAVPTDELPSRLDTSTFGCKTGPCGSGGVESSTVSEVAPATGPVVERSWQTPSAVGPGAIVDAPQRRRVQRPARHRRWHQRNLLHPSGSIHQGTTDGIKTLHWAGAPKLYILDTHRSKRHRCRQPPSTSIPAQPCTPFYSIQIPPSRDQPGRQGSAVDTHGHLPQYLRLCSAANTLRYASFTCTFRR